MIVIGFADWQCLVFFRSNNNVVSRRQVSLAVVMLVHDRSQEMSVSTAVIGVEDIVLSILRIS